MTSANFQSSLGKETQAWAPDGDDKVAPRLLVDVGISLSLGGLQPQDGSAALGHREGLTCVAGSSLGPDSVVQEEGFDPMREGQESVSGHTLAGKGNFEPQRN